MQQCLSAPNGKYTVDVELSVRVSHSTPAVSLDLIETISSNIAGEGDSGASQAMISVAFLGNW